MKKLQRYTSTDTGISRYSNSEYLISWDGSKIVVLHRPTGEKMHVFVSNANKIEAFATHPFTGDEFKLEIPNKDVKEACLEMAAEITEYLKNLTNAKLTPLSGFSRYMVNTEGKIFKIVSEGLREVASNMDRYGFLRVNLQQDAPNTGQTTKRVPMLVYESFKGKPNGELVFLDGDRENCRLDNLVSMEELIECYKANN